jgi:hypothetical protein
MSWLSERMVINTQARFLQGLKSTRAVTALDLKAGASVLLPIDKHNLVSAQLGAFATGGLAVDMNLPPTMRFYVGGGLSASLGMALPSSFGVTVSGELLTRGLRFSAMVNVPLPIPSALSQGISPHLSAGYVYEHKTDFRPQAQTDMIHGFVMSVGLDMVPLAFSKR